MCWMLGVEQIPCNYCVYIDTKQAKMYGATEEEIKEAIAEAALTRYMSAISYGNQRDFEAFKSQWDKILKYVEAHNKSTQTK
jgi:alkylhydroperoxidase/carboxymuconolactone decarboxylase family protein YurZ